MHVLADIAPVDWRTPDTVRSARVPHLQLPVATMRAMPWLILTSAAWIGGLLLGLLLPDGAGSSASASLAPWVLALAALLAMLATVALVAGHRGRHRAAKRFRLELGLSLAAVVVAGLLCSSTAQRDVRRCRTRAVAAFARGAALSFAYDGPLPAKPSANPSAKASTRTIAKPQAAAEGRPERGRGQLHFVDSGATTTRSCRIAATVRLPRPLTAGSVVLVQGTALATDRGLRLEVDSLSDVVRTHWFRTWRGRTGVAIDRLFGTKAPLVRALVIADQDGIAPDVRDRFADAGLVHMLSVSGMHVAIIASALPPTIGALCSLVLILAYVAMLGAPAPAVRSAVMLLTVMLSRAWQRPLHEWTALSLGAVIPTVDPLVVVDLGWQLSVSGMAALVAARAILRRLMPSGMFTSASAGAARSGTLQHLLARSIRRLRLWIITRRGVTRWLVRETITGSVATIVTAPLIAWTFGRVSVLAPLTNIVAGPIVAFLQPALFLALLFSWCEPLAQLVADASILPMRLLDEIATAGAAAPFAVLHVAPTRATAICVGIASLAVVCATASRRIAGWIRLAAVSLTVAVWLPVLTRGSGVLEVHMIDVGQGDAFGVRTPRGRWIIIDAGPSWDGGDAGRRRVVPYVQRRGGAVVLMVMSHAHEDHVGGAASVISALGTEQWWEPAFVTTSSGYRNALAVLRRSGATWLRVRPSQRWTLDGVTLEVLAPDSAWTAAQTDANETSVVLRVSYGRRRFLFMGDAEEREEAWLLQQLPAEALRADVLKLGHHGSKTSSGDAFIRAVSPVVGLVSVGAGNQYRHPSPEVLERFAGLQVPLLRTDLEGAVLLRTDGERLEAESNGDRWVIPTRDVPRRW